MMTALFKALAATSILATSGLTLYFVSAETHDSILTNDKTLKKQVEYSTAKVAVIGAGIGGGSATHFLRKSLGPSAQIDVYEKSDRIGGRLEIVTLNKQSIEAGGTIIHDSNKYMVDFTKELGLETNKVFDSKMRLGIFDGEKFVFSEGSYSWLNEIKMVWRYGLLSLWRLNNTLRNLLRDFQNIYTLQDEGNAYKTVQEMLEAMGGKSFYEFTQQSCKEVMKNEGIGELVIDELVTAVGRCNYGQDAETINGFTGYVSMAGGQDGELWNVKGGNYQVPQRLMKSSHANMKMKSQVTGIRKELNKETGKAVYFLEGAGLDSIPYDAVVVAVPLEIPSCFLTCHQCQHWPEQEKLGKYQKTIASFVQASANFRKFGFEKAKDMPEVVFTTESEKLNFTTLAPERDLKGDITKPSIYKVFSREPLSRDTLNELFEFQPDSPPEYSAISWLAYPHYTPPESFLRFELDDGVFYVNAIERAASAMEMSAIGGRNAALLTIEYLKGESADIKKNKNPVADEL